MFVIEKKNIYSVKTSSFVLIEVAQNMENYWC